MPSGAPYHLIPGADALLELPGAKHYLGGVMGYSLAETDDEEPEQLAVTQRMTWAYLWSALHDDDRTWQRAVQALHSDTSLGTVRTK